MQRMESSHRKRRSPRELEVQFGVKDTATLVAACNRSKDNQEQHDAFLDWIKEYVRFFEQLSISDSHQLAMEFVQLADVVAEDARTKELVRNAFCCLCSKIRDNNYGDEKLILALCYFLLSVDCQAFQGNPHLLTRLARDVIAKLGPDATFSRGTYPTHSVSLFALHHLCAVIHEVGPAELDHGRQGGLFQQINRCLENIINTQTYYPFRYQAMLTRQSLASMDSNGRISSTEMWYRFFHAIRGVAYFYQALAEVATLKINVESFDKSVEELTEAFAQHNIKSKHWFEIVQELINFRMLVQNDPGELGKFQDCLKGVDEILDDTTNQEDQLVLRYTMIRQVTLLALDCPSKEIREWAVGELFNFGTSHAQRKGWGKDVKTLEALLDAMLEIHQIDEFADQMDKVIDHMKLYFRTEEQSKTIIDWISITQWKRDDKRMPKSRDEIGGNVLFKKIKARLSIDELIPTQDEVHRELRKTYERESEVPSLFDNETPKHVQALHHSLMFLKKEVSNDGQAKVELIPFKLEDLFTNRKLIPKIPAERVKQVFLFGNPGTGKTTIAKKIAYMWSIGAWGDHFQSLFLLPIRELVSIKYDDLSTRTRRNLHTAITNICFPGKDNDDEYEEIKQHVKEDLDKGSTLVVFDGFDEGEQMTKEMMKSLESKFCKVLVLSRPRNLKSVMNSPHVEVECMGMNEAQLIKFIKTETSSLELVEHLQKYPSIWEIAHIPVVANVLVFLYKTKKNSIISDGSSLDMFSLYWKMSLEIWNRFVDKTESNAERTKIFEALEEIAFRALEDGQILITQQLVHEIRRNRKMRDVLKDSGFLLLKKEGVVYQFPHLTFQEFFAGQYMAHSLMGTDDERRKRAIDFLAEHKYCANFRQTLCFMIQACIAKKGDEGYQEMVSFIDATPNALGYKQHLLLNLELLEAALSASKEQYRKKILNSTKVLEIALEWIRRIIWGNRKFSYNPLVPFRNAAILALVVDHKEQDDRYNVEVFAKAAKVARYNRNQWEKVMKMIKSRPLSQDARIVELCRWWVRKTAPEARENIRTMPLEDYDSDDEREEEETMESPSNTGRLTSTPDHRIREAYEILFINKSIVSQTSSNAIEHTEEFPNRPHEIVKLLKNNGYARNEDLENHLKSSIEELAKTVHERTCDVAKLIREWSDDDDETRFVLADSCFHCIRRFFNKYKEDYVEILWTLCEDDAHEVCTRARHGLIHSLKDLEVLRGPPFYALLKRIECEPDSCRSYLMQLVHIAHDLIERAPEDLISLFSNLSQEYIHVLYIEVTFSIAICDRAAIKRKMRLHLLHLLCLKVLKPLEVEVDELLKTIEEVSEFPDKVVVLSIRLFNIPMCLWRNDAPGAISEIALILSEVKEDLVDTVWNLLDDTDNKFEREACVSMICCALEEPQKAERTMNRFEQLIRFKGCSQFVETMRNCISLDQVLSAYMKCHNELLIPFIVRKLFDTPVTVETMSDGSTQLIVQTASDSKKTYHFRTAEEFELFRSIVEKCTERRFQEVAPLIWSWESKRQEQST